VDGASQLRGLTRICFIAPVIGGKDALMDIDKELDTRGLNCPLPILKAKKALAEMESGQLLKVVATDPGSTRDFQAFARQTGNELVEQTAAGDEFIHVLKRR
jgi:tRNA 2-thiouridine synthesizing protein A